MINRKIANKSGFSLAETLLAVLILLLVSVIVANGVPAATKAYEKVVLGANAKVLLSTTISALRDELATAKDLTVTDNIITYYSADSGATSRIFLDAATVNEYGEPGEAVVPRIMIQEYIDANPSIFSMTPSAMLTVAARPLVPSKAATGDLYVTYEKVDPPFKPGDETITIKDLKVMRESSDTVFAEADLTIRLLLPTATEE